MIVTPLKTRIFREGEDLLTFILHYVPKLKKGSILVITSKIVALAEKRTAAIPTKRSKEELIRTESEWAIKTEHVWLTLKNGTIMANAGIDSSNADGKLILLPRNSFQTANKIRSILQKRYRIKDLGVLITDSRILPLRAGVVGVALGYAGFEGLRDYRKTKDIFGRPFAYSRTDVADSLATAAVLTMGEGKEQQPLCVIEDAPVQFTEKVKRNELKIDPKDDLYRPFFKNLHV